MSFAVSVAGRLRVVIVSTDPTLDQAAFLEQHLEQVMENLLSAEAQGVIRDPDISAKLAENRVEISVLVEAETPAEAVNLGTQIIRTAIELAGGYTLQDGPRERPEWELDVDTFCQRPVDLIDA
ncbi:MAG: hypothetical protein ACODAG_08125 [Myxococcota bacterium]